MVKVNDYNSNFPFLVLTCLVHGQRMAAAACIAPPPPFAVAHVELPVIIMVPVPAVQFIIPDF